MTAEQNQGAGRWAIAWAVAALAVIVWAGSDAEEDAIRARSAAKALPESRRSNDAADRLKRIVSP